VNLLVSLEAGLDIAEAVEFLRDRSPQLPTRFRQSLERSYSSIVEHPAMFPVVHRQFRRALLRHFPTRSSTLSSRKQSSSWALYIKRGIRRRGNVERSVQECREGGRPTSGIHR
jgi:plasmid stabilization system protein ParE